MTNALAWFYMFMAIVFEVAGTASMKLSAGFAHLLPSILIFVFYALSFGFLSLSICRLEIGFAYAIWSAIGTVLIFIIGVFGFGEPLTVMKTISLACIIVGVIGLKQT